MTVDSKPALDDLHWRLLDLLREDARLPFAELGRRLGLSAPAVAERVRRLEDLGVLKGFRPVLDRARLGWPVTAFVRLRASRSDYPRIESLVSERPEILECHHVAGEDSFVLKVACTSIPHLDRLVDRLSAFGATSTTLVLSSWVEERTPGRPKP